MSKITKYLNQLTVGNVFDAPEVLEMYSMDRSALKIKPKLVALPESTDDIRKLVKFFNQLSDKDIRVPIAVRGSGLGEGGAGLTNGIVISTEKLNRLLEIDPREKLVRVQAGITLKELNTALSVSGLTIPVGGKDNYTIGELIASFPDDDYAGKYGGISRYISRIEVVLSNGECLQTNRLKKHTVAKKAVEKNLEGALYRKISKVIKVNESYVKEMGRGKRDRSGYPLIAKVSKKETLDLMPLFFGSEGTLGIISEVILHAVPLKKRMLRIVATFEDLQSAQKFVTSMKNTYPREVKLYDLRIIEEAKAAGKNLDGILKKPEEGFAIFMSFDEKSGNYIKKMKAIKKSLPKSTKIMVETPEKKRLFDEFENTLSNYLNSVRSKERVPILTDFYVPKRNLTAFVDDLKILEKKLDLELELFGSYATSNYSVRPKFDVEGSDFNKKAVLLLKAGAFIIDRQGGVLTGGTSDGRLKALITNSKMIEIEKNLYSEVKSIFDPNRILSPDIKLGNDARFTVTHFRDTSSPKIMI